MWCLIRFHWGVCHYFISRAIWWASVSCWKTSCLRGEQWVRRQQSVKAAVYICEGHDGEDGDEIEWDRARDMWGSACCSCIIFPSWFAVLTCSMYVWMVMWKACWSLGSSVFLFCEAGTPGRGFSCYPAGGTVRVLSSSHWESTLFAVQCAYCISICLGKVLYIG